MRYFSHAEPLPPPSAELPAPAEGTTPQGLRLPPLGRGNPPSGSPWTSACGRLARRFSASGREARRRQSPPAIHTTAPAQPVTARSRPAWCNGVRALNRQGLGHRSRTCRNCHWGTTQRATHQTRHASSRTMRCPFLQPKACQNSGMFDTTLFTRYGGYECELVSTRVRTASVRASVHHEFA
jgi:hypothetical protein